MKLNKVLLAAGAALGFGAVSVLNASSPMVVNATGENMSRINVLTMNSYWTAADATTLLNFSNNTQSVLATKDADIGDTVVIGDNTYTLYTCLVDLNNLGSYNDTLVQRYSSDGLAYWDWEIWGGYIPYFANGNRNTIEITTGGTINNWDSKWWKLVTYSGVSDYENLSLATKEASFAMHGSSVSDPSAEAPEGTSFAGWYTDPDLEDDWSGMVTSDLTLYAKYAANTFTITKEIYKDDTLDSSTTDSVAEGDDYHLSDPSSIIGYVFDGWYTRVNNNWGNKITSLTNVTADQTVGARFRSRAQYTADSYIYYVADLASGTTMTPNYIYTYGGDYEFGAWPGTKISDLVEKDLHGSLGFRGWADYGYNRCIFRIPFNSVFGDTNVILNVGSNSDQSADMSLVSGSAYYWGGKDDDAGAAIDFLLMTEGFRNGVTASTGILNYSVCGIDPSDAADIYGDYEELSDKAKGYVCDSFVYTYTGKYDGVTEPGEGSIDYGDVITEIYLIALKDSAFASNHNAINVSPLFINVNNSALVIAVISFAAILAVGGFFFLRTRKEY